MADRAPCRISSSLSDAGPTSVTVLSAARIDANTVRWTFSATIDSISLVDGFQIAGNNSDGLSDSGTNWIECTYTAAVIVGQTAHTDLGQIDIAFVGGGTLASFTDVVV